VGYSQENASAGDALKDLFFVTSGCCRRYGAFTYQEKFQQTLETLYSIRKFKPDSDVILIESSNSKFPAADYKSLSQLAEIHEVLDTKRFMSDMVSIDANQFKAKTIGEFLAFERLFDVISERYRNYRRIFKISGRYQLTPEFLRIPYDHDQVVIRKPQLWGAAPDQPYINPVYTLKLWSWPASLTPELSVNMMKVFDEMLEKYKSTQKIDIIEFHMYKVINDYRLSVMEVDNIGVSGWYGQDGVPVTE
jgi:hypothetical protein